MTLHILRQHARPAELRAAQDRGGLCMRDHSEHRRRMYLDGRGHWCCWDALSGDEQERYLAAGCRR